METVIMGKDAQYPDSRNCSRMRLWSLITRSSIRIDGMIVITRTVSDKQLINNDLHIVNQSHKDFVKSVIPTDTDVS